MSPRLLLCAPLILVLASPGFAEPPALDPEPSGPCLWRVVVKIEPHPLLTSSFRDQVRRDLIAALQPAIGPLGTADVIDLDEALAGKADALVQDFAAKGFAALDTPRDLTGVKTHFLRIEVRDGQYDLETRQHDGFVGLASPVVRKQSTRSPELVGRAAGLMIDRDFGLAGTLEQPYAANATEVTVRFRGGKLGPIDRFIKEGDILALSQITKAANRAAPPPARTATGKIIAPPPGSIAPPALIPKLHSFTLLKVLGLQPDGSARCAVFRSPNFKATLPGGPAVMGYRCLKLSTVQSPISVRLVSGDGAAATSSSASVRAAESGFSTKEDPKDYLDFRDGLYRSSRPFANMACITVALGKTKAEHFPVPVLGPEPITLRFELSPEAEARAVFERSAIALSTRAADARIAQQAAFDGIGKLIVAQKNSDALGRARAAFEAADASDKVLGEELEQLKPQAGTVPGAAALFANVERQLASLRTSNTRLAATIAELEKVVEKENDPAVRGAEVKAQSLNTRINLLLAGGEIEEALAAYDQLATLQPNDAGIKARKEKLAAEWKPKDAMHAKEREYLLKTWPAVATIGDLKESLPQLRTAVDVCKKAGDRHAFRRFVGILGGFPAKLTDLIKDLDPNSDADRKALGDAKIVRDIVSKIEQEAVEYLRKE
jgi:tetratricopeptide (TPR) repeat protein